MAMNRHKRAEVDHPIEDVFVERYSPYAFDPRPVEAEKLRSVLEAARWAASSFNEQPWAFMVAERQDEAAFARMVGCLVEANQGWAQHAGVLMIAATKRQFSRNNKANRVCEHDVGLAAGNLTIQATLLGLAVHQMAGIDVTKTRHTYGIPEGWDPITAIAIGYAADPDEIGDDELAQRDRAPRTRRKLGEFVFGQKFGEASGIVG